MTNLFSIISFAVLRRALAFSALAVAASLMVASQAVAAGGGSSSGGGTTTPPADCTNDSTDCEDDKLHDNQVYDLGASLAQAGRYERAIEVLLSANDLDDPRILNYLGYSHRKLGRIGTGIAYYGRALDINPDFVLAREYLGEGYVSIGRIDKAEEQLDEIAQRCGVSCEEYVQLAQVIADARNGVTAEW